MTEPSPWSPPPAPADPRRNRRAWWGLGLAVASLVPGVGVAGLLVSALGLRRARRLGGRGRVPALVGLVVAAVLLAVDVGAGTGALVGARAHRAPVASASSPSSDGSGQEGSSALPDPHDRGSSDLSATQQAYVDDLDDVTYLNFSDTDLLKMGHEACSDFDADRTPEQDSDRLGERFGAGVGDAWDVQRAATKEFCPQHAGLLVDHPTNSV